MVPEIIKTVKVSDLDESYNLKKLISLYLNTIKIYFSFSGDQLELMLALFIHF